MKKKAFVVAIALSLLLGMIMVAVGGEMVDGEEKVTENIDYEIQPSQEINDWHDLDTVRDGGGGNYILKDDLDEDTAGYDQLVDTEEGWEPIEDFPGTFDGNGHKIRDLYIDRPEKDSVGLFGSSAGEIENVELVDADIKGGDDVGGLTGVNYGEVINSGVEGQVTGDKFVGGIIGREIRLLGDTTLRDSYFEGEIRGEIYVGGIVGYIGDHQDHQIENSHYNVDEVLINGENHITFGGLFHGQYQDWIEDKELEIEDYEGTLVPSGDHYEINDAEGFKDLLGFAGDHEKSFRLSDDVDLSEEPGLHIPYLAADFDGDSHIVSGLTLNQPFGFTVSLFAYNEDALVENLGIFDCDIEGHMYVGGLVGRNDQGEVMNCYAKGEVSGNDSIGGLVASNAGSITDSYSLAEVSGETSVGGLIGANGGDVVNTYAAGDVRGDKTIGGLVGRDWNGTVKNSFWDTETTGQDESDGGTGKSTEEMKDVATYTDTDTEGLEEPWDFVGNPNDDDGDEEIWDIDEEGVINDGYPAFAWEEEVEIEEEDEEDEDGIPGFTSTLLLLALVIVVAVHYKKKR
ncbi:MAG: GLUG motif-containing protein [Candidatus Aenigmatarchaeota archaeon]